MIKSDTIGWKYAAHLATFCESALKTTKHIPILPIIFIFPSPRLNDKESMSYVIPTVKGATKKIERVVDSKTKEKNASREIKKDAAMFLNNGYKILRQLSSAVGGADFTS